jgi:hypothetical protein
MISSWHHWPVQLTLSPAVRCTETDSIEGWGWAHQTNQQQRSEPCQAQRMRRQNTVGQLVTSCTACMGNLQQLHNINLLVCTGSPRPYYKSQWHESIECLHIMAIGPNRLLAPQWVGWLGRKNSGLSRTVLNVEVSTWQRRCPQKEVLLSFAKSAFSGAPYGVFAGRDASRGLATFSLTQDVLKSEYDDLSDLNSMQMDSVREWEMQFTGTVLCVYCNNI